MSAENEHDNTITLTDALDAVEAWVGPHPGGKSTPAPDFRMRCCIRKLVRAVRAAHVELGRLDAAVDEAHKRMCRA